MPPGFLRCVVARVSDGILRSCIVSAHCGHGAAHMRVRTRDFRFFDDDFKVARRDVPSCLTESPGESAVLLRGSFEENASLSARRQEEKIGGSGCCDIEERSLLRFRLFDLDPISLLRRILCAVMPALWRNFSFR